MQDEDELKDFLGGPEEGKEPETETGSSTSGNKITRRLSKREVPASKFYPSGDVGSQKSCGSCSMWSSLHVLNGFLGIANGGNPIPLSEKWLIDCWDRGDVKYDCHGVWDYWVYDWLKSHTPVVKNAYAPYTLPVEECATPTNGTFLTSYARKTYDQVTDDALVEMLQNGPLVASLKVEKPFFSYSQGILEMGESCTSVGGHAVAVVGYGSEDGVDFFILKNSWGYSWGDKGYFRVRRLGGGTTREQRYCRFGWSATQPILSGAMPAGFDANFEYTTEQVLPAFLGFSIVTLDITPLSDWIDLLTTCVPCFEINFYMGRRLQLIINGNQCQM